MVPPAAIDRWWTSAVGYEVYVRSFSDSNGDGIGDLPGIIERLDHLAWLGVDLVWMTPFFASPMADFGYDVADHTEVDPLFGTLDDFDALLERAHGLGIRVIADLVPNHTSDRHRWFSDASSDRGNLFRDYYIWRDPGPDGGPPNNWLSHFGGPAWTLDETTGQYYCHLFLSEQPDLNWRNPAVRQEFERILRFWLDRGLDGFRIDVAQSLYKDEHLRDNPVLAPLDGVLDARQRFDRLEHRYDLMQPETLDVFRRWREIARDYDGVLIGETYVSSVAELARLLPGDGLDIGFWFGPMRVRWTPSEIRAVLRAPIEQDITAAGWVQSSHDASRPVARFGGGDTGRRRSLALSTMMFGLPGLPFLYQGEELGLDDADVPPEHVSDPLAVRNTDTAGRDACRTPIPWAPGPNLGFSTAASTWLPVCHSQKDTVQAQREDASSHLHRVRDLVTRRLELVDIDELSVDWLDGPASLVAFARGRSVFALNVADLPCVWDPGDGWRIVYRTASGVAPREPGNSPDPLVTLGADEAVVWRRMP